MKECNSSDILIISKNKKINKLENSSEYRGSEFINIITKKKYKKSDKIESIKDKEKNNNKNNNVNKENASENEEKDEEIDDEKAQLIVKKEKLSKILNNIDNKLFEKGYQDKTLEEIYEQFNHKKGKKKLIKDDVYCFNLYSMYFFIAPIFITINLIGIYTLRAIMESFYEFWINSIQYFLYKESKLEKDGLTDFENLFNSSYNFYEHYFEYISSNEVNFDLMFFWDFVGGVLYDNCDFTCTAIIFLIINTAVLSFIGAFDYLDIDEKTHKYSFFQIIYISLVYLFLWVGIGSSALLSQQIYIDSFEILNKKRQKDWEMEQEAKEKERREIELLKRLRKALKKNKIIKENSSIEEEYSYRKKMDDSQSIYQMQKNIIKSFTDDWDKKKKRLESFYIIYLTNFLAFLINYIVNREIIKYREKYISKELEYTKKDDLHINIYLKDRNIFLLFICIPYILEIIISLIFYSIF